MKKFILAAFSVAIILTSAFYATAQNPGDEKDQKPPHHGKKDMISHMDANKDGKISKDEFIADATNRFKEIDSNNDGSVTQEEIKAHHKAMKENRKKMKEEMDEKMKVEKDKRFNEMDSDKSGSISKEEMDAFHEKNKGKRHMGKSHMNEENPEEEKMENNAN